METISNSPPDSADAAPEESDSSSPLRLGRDSDRSEETPVSSDVLPPPVPLPPHPPLPATPFPLLGGGGGGGGGGVVSVASVTDKQSLVAFFFIGVDCKICQK